MIREMFALSALAAALAIASPAPAQNSPSGDPTGNTRGVASDADPVGKPVGKEPAMIDPSSTGSVELKDRATIDCAKKPATEKAARAGSKVKTTGCK
jgi:hypothetical protein